MEANKTTSGKPNIHGDELANLKKISEINNNLHKEFKDLVICNASENHVNEVAELWANLACIQQVFAPDRFSFKSEGRDWRTFVRRKLEKTNNLLLVAYKKDSNEIKGFLYLQSITIPLSDLILKGVIEDIYTKPQHRKQKIATQLLNVAIDWATEQNIKEIDLILIEKAKALSNFYTNFSKKIKKDIKLELLIL